MSLFKKLREISNPYFHNDSDDEYIYEGYYPAKGLYYIKKIYHIAKEEGFTEEQREKFFNAIKTHNQSNRKMIGSISIKISSKREDKVYFDESELGAYAGYYSLEENEDQDSVGYLKKLQIEYRNYFFSLEGEHIKSDTIKRIPLRETMVRWKMLYKSLENDEIQASNPEEDLPF